jgi:hypothetical protein
MLSPSLADQQRSSSSGLLRRLKLRYPAIPAQLNHRLAVDSPRLENQNRSPLPSLTKTMRAPE